MLQLNDVTLYRGQKCLLDHANALIQNGERVGIVGSNGAGKTSFFKLIQGELEVDKGEYQLPNHVRIAEIRQEIPHGTETTLNYVLSGDRALAAILQQLRQAEESNDGMLIADCHHKLAELDGYSAESRAAKILVGLGFSNDDLKRSINDFSGGWRMRLNLAQVLLTPCDLLLLDEPTNHLDLEAIFWLEKWLSDMKITMLIISHDRDFLDHVAQRILFIKDQKLLAFTGSYSSFEEQYAMQLMQQQATFDKQQKQIAHMMDFVNRFRAKATKAKQAQSRMKMIERIDKVAPVHMSNPFHFQFKTAPEAGNPMLTIRQGSVGYGGTPVLTHVSLSVRPGDRLALIGPNGAGKSTLVKAIAQKLAIEGESMFNSKIKIGYFTQHQVDSLHLQQNSIWHLHELEPKLSERDARQFLGSFNFSNDRIFEPVSNFSGGEKARLALALLVWQQPNLLLLDEPSNHLDMEMRQALMTALQNYDGALILIAHDRYLLNSLINEFYLLADGKVTLFDGTLDDYEQWFSDWQRSKNDNKPVTNKPTITKTETDNLSKDLVKQEKLLAQQQGRLAVLETQLADLDLYQDLTRQAELNKYQREVATLKENIDKTETSVLQILEKLT